MDNKKIGIITGAGSGIGRASVIALTHAGWTIGLVGRKEEKLKKSAALCPAGTTRIHQGDVTKEEQIREIFSSIYKEFGRIDLLFNNAGMASAPLLPDDIPLETFKNIIQINVTGSFICAREAFKIMKVQDPQGGRIINNGSISAHVPRPRSLPYTTSKHAITGLTKSLSLDGRAFNIVCGQIDIGNASSPMTRQMESGVLQSDGTIQVEPTMDVSDVGKALLFMANLPLDTNIPFITLMANGMPYMGRG